MAMTLAAIRTAVYTRLEADASSPSYTAIATASIDQWANEKANAVIMQLPPIHYQALIDKDYTLTFSVGSAALPADFIRCEALRLGSNNADVMIYENAKDFSAWDSRNFILTPTDNYPVAYIADGYVHAKQESAFITGKMEYIKKHPTITISQPTVFSSIGDQMLIELIVEEAKKFLQTMD